MPTLTIDGTDYVSLAEAFSAGSGPSIGTYYCLPPYGHAPRLQAEEPEIKHITFPGVDGVWRKNMGYRGRPIHIQLATMNETKAAVWSDVSDLFDKFNKFQRYTIILPEGLSFDGCALLPGGGEVYDEFTFGGDGINEICVLTSWQFKQFSYSNG